MNNPSKNIVVRESQTTEMTGREFKQSPAAGRLSIPQSVRLAGLTISTIVDTELFKDRKLLGEARYPQQQIALDGSGLLHSEMWEQNYFHELVHWILYVMSEDALRDNEKFVDLFATFLHQALASAEGIAGRKT